LFTINLNNPTSLNHFGFILKKETPHLYLNLRRKRRRKRKKMILMKMIVIFNINNLIKGDNSS
jgi:hypothetical protein